MPPASKHRPRSLCPSSSAPSARRGQKAEPKAEILSATSGTTPATPQKTSDPGGGSQHTEQQLQALSQTNRASGLTHTCPLALPLKPLAPNTTFRGTYIHCQMLENRAGRLGAASCTAATFLPFTATLGCSRARGSRGDRGCPALRGQQRLQRAVNPTDLAAGSSLSPSWIHLLQLFLFPGYFRAER